VVEFLSELPHTPTGKLQRFKLRQRAADGADG
jgi:acyl-coenzyme A synthetase/AMP-(fatty) acid ligase